MKSRKILGFILTGVMLSCIFPQQSLANSDYIVSRVQGSDRYQTSSNISQSILNKHEKVVLASGENFADALSAGNYGAEATILLTQKDKIPSSVKEEINRLNPSEIIIVGGASSISKSIERELQGRNVKRIYGKDRYETSTKIASEFADKNNGFVLANGTNFADALAAAPYTVKKNQTLLLTNGKSLPEGIDKDEVVSIIGGKQSINIEGLENVKRISGKDRYETAIEVAKNFNGAYSIVIADGKNYPDALSASPLAISK